MCAATGIRFSPRSSRVRQINWNEWGEAAFEKARAEDKPALLSIAGVWCRQCHTMDETSYSDPEAIRMINQDFIAIRVDSDHRSDVDARYNMGGCPTTAFLTGDAEVITGARYLSPEHLKAALAQVSSAYRGQRSALLERVRETQGQHGETMSRISAGAEVVESIVEAVGRAVSDAFDPENGGFGTESKFPATPQAELLLHMYRCGQGDEYRPMAEKTLDGMMDGGLYDREEGGFFRYSTASDWSEPQHEKVLEFNADLLALYLHGYLITGKEEYFLVASKTIDYLNGHLYEVAFPGFYGSQNADSTYYALPLAERRQRSAPEVDRTFYTGPNARVASVYLEASWVMGRPKLATIALDMLESLLQRQEDQPLLHSYSQGGDGGIPALLTDYSRLVLALVHAYESTSQRRFYDEAERAAQDMVQTFRDEDRGAFYDIPEDPKAMGRMRLRHNSMGENVLAVDALISLYGVTLKQEHHDMAQAALSAFVPVYQDYGDDAAGYALAVHRHLHPPVEITVVGVPGRQDTALLLHAAAGIAYPNVAVKFMDSSDEDRLSESGYWPADEALAYACLETLCLAPVADPEALREAVAGFLESGARGESGFIQDLGGLDLGGLK